MKIKKNEMHSLVLSGGGALGIAQISVLKNLEENNIIYKEIIGTSIGSIIGSALAIGLTVFEISEIFEKFSKIENWIKFSLNGNSLIKIKKIEKILFSIFKDKKIKDANINLKIICTELETGNIKVFDKNDNVSIVDAILASIAIPGLFEERKIDSILYVDGFLIQNLGFLEATENSIIAIDVLGKESYNKKMPNNFFKTKNIFDMFEKSMRLLIINQTKKNIEILKASNSSKYLYIIEIDTSSYKTFQFHKFKELSRLNIKEIIYV